MILVYRATFVLKVLGFLPQPFFISTHHMAADIQSCHIYVVICKTALKDLGFFFPNPGNMCAMIGPVLLSAPLSTLRSILDDNAGDLGFPCMGDELYFLTKSRMQVQCSVESYVSVLDACWPCEYSIPFKKILPSTSSSAKHDSRPCVILAVVIENVEAQEAERQKKAVQRAAILFEKQREKAAEPLPPAKLKMPYRNVASMGAELVAAAELKQPVLKSAKAFGISPAHFNAEPRSLTQPLDVKGVATDSVEKHPELGDISAEATYLSTCMQYLRVHVERCNTGERYSNGHLLPEFVKGFNQVAVTISALLGGAAEIVANADGPPRRGAFEVYIPIDPSSKTPQKWILWSKLEHKQGLPTNVESFIRRMKEGLSKLFARISVKQLVQNHCRHQWKDWIGCKPYPDDTCSPDEAVTLKFDNSASKLSIKEIFSTDSLLIGREKKIEKILVKEEVQTSEPRIERCARWACLKEFVADSTTVDLDMCCHHPGVFQFRHSQGWWDAHWTCCAQPWEASGCATIQSHLCPPKPGYRREPEWPHHDAQFHFRPQTSGPRKTLYHRMTRGEVDRRYIITKSEPGEKALRNAWNEVSGGHPVISYPSFDEGQLILMKLCHAMKLKELAIFPAARVTFAEIVRRKSLAMIDSNETGVLVYESFRAWWFSKLSMYAAVTELSALENPPLPVQTFMEWQADVDKEKQRIMDFRLNPPVAPIEFAFDNSKASDNTDTSKTLESTISKSN